MYSHASLSDVDIFEEMHHWTVPSLCEHQRVYLHKSRWYSLLLLGYKPIQHVTLQNIRLNQVQEKMIQSRDSNHESAAGVT